MRCSLNLSHNRLTEVDRLCEIPSLTNLNLSKNKISSLSGICLLPALEELWLRDNAIADINSMQPIAFLTTLKRLVVKPNPVCRALRPQSASEKRDGEKKTGVTRELYWHVCVSKLSNLEFFEAKPVSTEAKDSASAFMLSSEGRKALRDNGFSFSQQAAAVPPAPPTSSR